MTGSTSNMMCPMARFINVKKSQMQKWSNVTLAHNRQIFPPPYDIG